MYHFLSGYTARVAGTDDRRNRAGSDLLHLLWRTVHAAAILQSLRQPARERIAKGGVKCWLVNTGWSGGSPQCRASSACRSRRPARCSTRHSTAAWTAPNSARIPTSASECRSRFRASSAQAARSARCIGGRRCLRPHGAGTRAPAHRQLRAVCRSRGRKRASGSPGCGGQSQLWLPSPSGSSPMTLLCGASAKVFARTLPKADWTHEAHLAACLWLLRERPDFMPETGLPGTISAYNVAAGGENTAARLSRNPGPALRARCAGFCRDTAARHCARRCGQRAAADAKPATASGRCASIRASICSDVAARRRVDRPDLADIPTG